MENLNSWERITYLGNKLRQGWIDSAKRQNVNISTYGLSALSSFTFDHKDSQKYKTLLAQEFLKKGYLASSLFYASYAHNEKIIKDYLEIFESILFDINKCNKGILNIDDLIEGPIAYSNFKRLN